MEVGWIIGLAATGSRPENVQSITRDGAQLGFKLLAQLFAFRVAHIRRDMKNASRGHFTDGKRQGICKPSQLGSRIFHLR
jgi:hypothetical protein